MAKHKKIRKIKEIPEKIKEIKVLPLNSKLEQEVEALEIQASDNPELLSSNVDETTPIIMPARQEGIQETQELPRTQTQISRESQSARENFSQNIMYDTRLHQENPVYATPERTTAGRARIIRRETEQFSPAPMPQETFTTQETQRLQGKEEKAYHEPLESTDTKPKRRYPWEA